MLVSQAAFANPFSQQRAEINRKISGTEKIGPRHKILPQVITEVTRRLKKLDTNSNLKVKDFVASDQLLMERVFLFDIYHRYLEKFNELIQKQIKSDGRSVTVDFAEAALDLLRSRGFDNDRAKKYFALYYQIRRAFHFIEKGLIGKGPLMVSLRMDLWNNIFTYDIFDYDRFLWDKMEDFSVILLGPTGCGKGTAAAALGRSCFIPFNDKSSKFVESFTRIFIPINLSQFPETLVESELFGHTKGSFTGAVNSHDGLFALCGKHGSIFLDEIGEIGQHIQIKLLQVLQERVFSPVGSHKKLEFHGRVIAATNSSIDKLRQEGKFRDDFYYRLCSDCVVVPSLKERIRQCPDELYELISHTVKRVTGYNAEKLVETSIEIINKNLGKNYPWPGNVRELEQCIRRIIVKQDCQGDTSIDNADMLKQFLNKIEAGQLDAMQVLEAYCAILYKRFNNYQQVAKVTGLDRRTVKKYIQNHLAV